ncbi:plasmid transfer protein TraA [Streptomyces sp. S1]|uniref:plasmid transfer protein TraA n=2 Tax=unclassified Streptomyces TaxID=2593676 RepID=UPI001F0915D1|nr:plasmid transfer protein TraA [Streptomyces sp. S1]
MSTPTGGPRVTPPRPASDPKNDATKFGFSPAFTINMSSSKSTTTTTTGGAPAPTGGGRPHSEASLPAPEFTSPADVRNYCNALRALMVGVSFEVSMGAEILKGVLATVPDPEGRLGASKARAWRVSRKLAKSAEAAAAAAKNAAACYAAFQQQYEEEINRVRHRARKPSAPRMDWARQ